MRLLAWLTFMLSRSVNDKLQCLLDATRIGLKALLLQQNEVLAEQRTQTELLREQTYILYEIRDALVDQPASYLKVYIEGKELQSMETRVITTDEQITASIAPVSASGKPAKVEAGSVKWSAEGNLEAVTLKTSDDGFSCTFIGVLPDAEILVRAEADADLGDGVKTISSDVFRIETKSPQAAGLGVTLGDPGPQA